MDREGPDQTAHARSDLGFPFPPTESCDIEEYFDKH